MIVFAELPHGVRGVRLPDGTTCLSADLNRSEREAVMASLAAHAEGAPEESPAPLRALLAVV